MTINKTLVPSTDTGKFNLQIDGSTAGTGANVGSGGTTGAVVSTVGAHTVSETAGTATSLLDYTSVITGDCASDGSITLAVGDNKTCTITNTKKPKLTVTKVVTNDNGGTKGVSDFPLTVDAGSVTSSVQNTFSVGSHIVAEASHSGYTETITGDCAADGTITLAAGDVKSCTITNNDIAPSLTLNKIVVNDDGGTAPESAWTLTATGPSTISGPGASGSADVVSSSTFQAGAYTLSESAGPAHYTASSWSCVKNSGSPASSSTITLDVGDNATCTVTNDDDPASLTVVKNTLGGDGKFSFTGTGLTGFDITTSGLTGSSTLNGLSSSTYSLAETVPDGWDLTSASCDVGGASASGTLISNIVLSLGQHGTCTFTDTKRASITVVKDVVGPNGEDVSDTHSFTVTLNGGNSASVSEGNSHTYSNLLPNQQYTIAENQDANYGDIAISGSCAANGTVTPAPGQNATCTVTNKQKSAHLTVVKHVTNHGIGTAAASNFTMQVTATNPSSASFAGSEDGTAITLNPGSYSVGETGPEGYAMSQTESCSGSMVSNGSSTCTVTNSDIPTGQGAITVMKHVVNDDGGTLGAGSFTLTVKASSSDAQTVTNSQASFFAPGSYTVSESDPTPLHYTKTSTVCQSGATTTTDGSVTLAAQQAWVCTVTNDDVAPRLTVIKHVINDNGGTKTAGDFSMQVTGTNVKATSSFAGSESGTTVTLNQGAYSVDEATTTGYAKSIGENCSGTIGIGESRTCTVTNDDQPATLTIVKHAVGADSTFTFNVTGHDSLSLGTVQGSATSSAISLNAGTYNVTENAKNGWSLTSASCEYNGGSVGSPIAGGETISVDPGDSVVCTFTNTLGIVVSGTKWDDANGNGLFDEGESGIAGWTIGATPIDTQGGTATSTHGMAATTVTDASGNYSFKFQPSDFGWWRVSETPQDNWALMSTSTPTYDVNVTAEATPSDLNNRNFGNWHKPVITVTKWNDGNGNGVRNTGEQGMSGWNIGLGKVIGTGTSTTASSTTNVEMIQLQLTGSDGTASFRAPAPGHYVVLEENRSGWSVTSPAAAAHDPLVLSRADGVPATPDFRTDSFFDVFVTVDGGTITTGLQGATPRSTTTIPLQFGNHDQAHITVTTDGPSTTTTSTDAGDVTTNIPGGTTATGPADWDGIIRPPTATTTYAPPIPDPGFDSATPVIVLEIGAGDKALTFDKAVKIIFAGQAGKYVGWSRGGVFTQITAVCDDPLNPTLAAGADCKINVGADLVVWTKHFTVFIVYTQTPSAAPSGGKVIGVGGNSGIPWDWRPGVAVGTTGEVLGASTSTVGGTNGTSTPPCVALITKYMRRGANNDPGQVKKLQQFLNGNLGSNLPITGFFGPMTEAAVKAFQLKYADQILKPQGLTKPTGYVYKFTLPEINLLNCSSTTASG